MVPVQTRVEKQTVDGAVALNIHMKYINLTTGRECPFCQGDKMLDHLFLRCAQGLFDIIRGWYRDFKESFTRDFVLKQPNEQDSFSLFHFRTSTNKNMVYKKKAIR